MFRRSDDILSEEELHLRKRKRIMFAGGALILLLFILFFVFGARPTVHAIKLSRRDVMREMLFALMDKQKWDLARVEAIAAYQLRPSEPQALRAPARFLSRTHHADALEFWRQLAEKTTRTREDLRAQASIALTSGANTYTGATTVNGGALFVNGSTSSSSAVTVNNSGTTLGGSGTIGGSVNVASSGANLAPGATGNGSTAILNTGVVNVSFCL
jgi:autotransporter-associated beta strand protein